MMNLALQDLTRGSTKLSTTNPALFKQYVDGATGTGVGSSKGEKQANYAYSGKDGNGDEASGDGYTYRGRGLLQITRQGKYERVTNGGFRAGGAGQANVIPGLNQIYGTQNNFVANPDQILTKTNSARSSTWYWRYESSRGDLNIRADNDQFGEIVKGIHGSLGDLANREIFRDCTNKVLGDQNTFSSISQMLGIQGINAKQADGYNTKFGIALKSRTPVAITTPRNLVTQDTNTTPEMPADLVNQLLQDFEINREELDMLSLDVIPPDAGAAMVVAVSAPTVKPSRDGIYGAIGACALVIKATTGGVVGTIPDTASRRLLPGDAALQIFESYSGLNLPEGDLYTSEAVQDEAGHSTRTVVIEPPKHGRVVWLGDKGNEVNLGITNSYAYEPHKGYVGKDRVTFMTELAGRRIKVVYYIRATDKTVDIDDFQKTYEKYCPRRTWPMSDAAQGASDITAWSRSAELSTMLASASQSLTGFADLASTAVGETTGTGPSATITLDTNAAGHGWYVDPTPLDNTDDYLPTSEPTVFQAKAGSAAAGKIDMLSVLLHEYGHALGLEHSASGADFMAASLQPGVRKLPSAAELTLMARLVAELKGADGDTLTLGAQGHTLGAQGQVL